MTSLLQAQARQIKQLTKKQQQAELDKANAEAANLAKNKYLSGVSHELRTPLNVIMGYAQLLENNTDTSDPNYPSYSLIRKNSEHLSHLIEGILEFSAIEAGKLRVQMDVIDLQQLITQIEQMFTTQAKQKNLDFKTNITSHLPQYVKTDGKRLKQILFNLLSNAIKFTDYGYVNFSVHYRNQIATIEVADTGCGISNDQFENIFKPFERVENLTKNIPGTGLGLTIAKLLTELLGGELTVKSEPSEGTVFTLKLMLSAQSTTTNPTSINLKTTQQKHRILIVDDVAEHRELLENMLRVYGFKIDLAEHPKRARELIKQNTYDLAFFDIAMPQENGWQLASWCRKQHHTFKIVMVSANPRDKDQQHQSHHQAYITKPIHITNLLTTVKQLLQLDWEVQPTETQPKVDDTVTETVKINRKDRLTLQQLIDIGHINGIEKHLKTMQDNQMITTEHYQHLMKPLQQLNLKKLATLIGIDD
ncbi:MAG: response regulator [Xanthomonadales bacterium]|nr:response regulator [Xanthomonadales bacterium]